MFAGGAISHDALTGLSLELSIISRWKTQLELICPMAAPSQDHQLTPVSWIPRAALAPDPLKSVWHLYALLQFWEPP